MKTYIVVLLEVPYQGTSKKHLHGKKKKKKKKKYVDTPSYL